jgi:hypothetical protein
MTFHELSEGAQIASAGALDEFAVRVIHPAIVTDWTCHAPCGYAAA